MAATTIESGTQAAAASHALGSGSTTAGVFVGQWNLTNMANGDVVRCWITTKVLTGDTAETIYEGSYAHDQGTNCIVASPPVISMHSVRMHVERVAGAASIDVPWSLIAL